jgi:threonine synthase
VSPERGMSGFQKAHMGEQSGGNIHNLSIGAPFDKLNDLLDRLKSQKEFERIAAVNSINWGRVVGQIPYYFAGYLQVVGDNIGQEIDVIVPSGNMGDALAAHYARRMGLPLREVVFANNENNALHNLVQSGVYLDRASEITTSPSMDICKPKNYERLLFELMEGDGSKVADYMQRFADKGRVALSDYGLSLTAIKDAGFDSGSSSHADRIESIRWVYDSSGYVIDSHTADAVSVARRRELKRPALCMQTALSVKSEPTVEEALGFVPERPDQFKEVGLGSQNDGFVSMPYNLESVAAYIRQHRIARQPVEVTK